MDYTQAFAISAAGMDVERLRVEVATLNLANANSVLGPGGAGYQAQRVVVWPGPVASVEPSALAPRRWLDAGHPLADAQGFVRHPGIDITLEMVTLMTATRAYEANVAAMTAARSMALKALEIGSGA